MRSCALALTAALLLGACGAPDEDREATGSAPTEAVDRAEPAARPAPPAWVAAAGDDGTTLRLAAADGRTLISVGCRANPQRFMVTVPGFERIGSEDRLSVGFDDEPVALAADLSAPGAGVTADGPIPADLPARIKSARRLSAVYGRQRSGPHPAPAGEAAAALADACATIERADPSALPETPAAATSPQAAATVVETYFALLGAGKADDADRLWGGAGADVARRSLGARPTAEVYAPGAPQGAAGSVYVEVPVRVTSPGAARAGTVTLRRVNNVPGSTADQRRWRIEKLELR